VPPFPLTAPQRRTLGWGLVAVVLLTTAALGVAAVRRVSGTVGRLGAPAPARVQHQTVVERLREVAKLVATEMTLRDVVIYEQTRFGSTKRALLVVTGRVSAGVDLERGVDVRIDSAARRVTVALPPAEVLSVEVLDVTTYDERAGLLNPFRPTDRDAIQRRTRAQLETAARQSGILEHADRSAARALETLLARDGYTVEIRRPVVERRPTG
jgi:hypothetical protein